MWVWSDLNMCTSHTHTHTHIHECTYLYQRAPLESVILHVKKLDLGEPCTILSLALQPPNLFDIQRAVVNLKEVSAVEADWADLSFLEFHLEDSQS